MLHNLRRFVFTITATPPRCCTVSRMETDRYRKAVHALACSGEPVTLRRVCAWLLKHEGVGCSLRDAHSALAEWRESRTGEVARTVKRVGSAVRRELKPLDTDTRQRVVRALSDTPPWRGHS